MWFGEPHPSRGKRFWYQNEHQVKKDDRVEQCSSTFVWPRPGKFFFHKTRARSQQIYSSVKS